MGVRVLTGHHTKCKFVYKSVTVRLLGGYNLQVTHLFLLWMNNYTQWALFLRGMRDAYLCAVRTEITLRVVHALRAPSIRVAHLCASLIYGLRPHSMHFVYHALRAPRNRFAYLCASHTASMPFFKRNPFRPTDFSSTAKKSKQKKPISSQFFDPYF